MSPLQFSRLGLYIFKQLDGTEKKKEKEMGCFTEEKIKETKLEMLYQMILSASLMPSQMSKEG